MLLCGREGGKEGAEVGGRGWQVLNRLQHDYDAPTLSQGYRDVNLSLRLDTAETRRLGTDLHVCEVQLLLAEFALRKSDSGHKRYVAFRNARGR